MKGTYDSSFLIIIQENNGINWQIKFNNSGASVTIYDTNRKNNTVVNGKCVEGEKASLKEIVEGIKSRDLLIDPLNETIVAFINSKQEGNNYDFKEKWHSSGKEGDLLHDILCLANNENNEDAYLIFV